MSEAQFNKAVEIIQSLPKNGPIQPTQDEQLAFYGLYKQANEGDVTTNRPGMLDFVGKAKWDSWASHKGKSKDEAKAEYVKVFLEFQAKHPDSPEAQAHKKAVEEAAA